MSKNSKSTSINKKKSKTKNTKIKLPVGKKVLAKKLVEDDELFENDTVDEIDDIDDKKDNDFEEKICEIREALKQNYLQQKKLMADLKKLMDIHKKEIRLTAKTGNRTNSGKHSGFNKPTPIPPPLKKLLKLEEDMLPRSKITSLMYKYFEDNKMYDTETKKIIIPNKKIKEIFGMKEDDVITFYNIQVWLKKVYKIHETNNAIKMED